MTDYSTMQDRIADDLARTDLTTQIQSAILSAIKRHERTRFYFNVSVADTFSTVADQEYYGSVANAKIPNIITIDRLYYTISSNRYQLRAADADRMAASQGGFSVGDPSSFAYEAQQIRFFPIPNAVRTVTAAWHYRIALPTADASPWLNDAEELIRSSAEADLYARVIKDYQAAQVAKAEENEQRKDLIRETRMRRSNNLLVTDLPVAEYFDIRTG